MKVKVSHINHKTISLINNLGSEYDFVIFSMVRSMPRDNIRNKAAIQPDRTWLRENFGFITDRHQICVAITRARHGLIIVGECVYTYIMYSSYYTHLRDSKLIVHPYVQVTLSSSATMRHGEIYFQAMMRVGMTRRRHTEEKAA